VAAFECEYSSLLDHLPRQRERALWRQLADRLLKRGATQIAQLEHRLVLRQSLFDPILDRPGVPGRWVGGEQSQRLVRTETVAARDLSPRAVEVRPVGERLCSSVLQGEVAKLATLGRTTVPSTKPVRCACDLARAAGERVAQLLRDAGDLEILAVLAGALFDLVAESGELLGEHGAVVGAKLAGSTEHRPRRDSHDPLVAAADRARDDDVAM
jgi:hypothetical protein